MINTPPLAWVPSFCGSTGRALDLSLSHEVKPGIAPLAYVVHVQWAEPLEPRFYVGIWNLFQIWAHINEAEPQGRPIHAPYSMSVSLSVKERLGRPKNTHPLDSQQEKRRWRDKKKEDKKYVDDNGRT